MNRPTALTQGAKSPPPAVPPVVQSMADDDRRRQALARVAGQIRAAGQGLLAVVRKREQF